MQKIIFYKGRKRFSLEVKRCNFFGKFLGLMFSRRETAKALVFDFKNPCKKAIHSFFCVKFLAVWLDKENRIIAKKVIEPFSLFILPTRMFSKLIEIPFNKKYSKVLETLLK